MNIIAVDIGNTNITVGLFLNNEEEFIKAIPGGSRKKLADCFKSAWQKIPVIRGSKEKIRNGVIVVSSVKPAWTELVEQIARENLGENIYVIGRDIPLPMEMAVDEPEQVGADRILAASAAYAVIEDAVVVADYGTAVTIDLVDEKGAFCGGVILPGFEISAKALKGNTAQLPKIKVTRPKAAHGKTTKEAIKCGLYYSAVGTLREVVTRYAEEIGKWPSTVLTGAAAEVIKNDCEFIDRYVPNLVVKGIVLAYCNYIEQKQ